MCVCLVLVVVVGGGRLLPLADGLLPQPLRLAVLAPRTCLAKVHRLPLLGPRLASRSRRTLRSAVPADAAAAWQLGTNG